MLLKQWSNLFGVDIIPPDKRLKFKILRERILSSQCVGVKTLQRFAGKVISFSLAIPGCKVYVRETFKAISQLRRSSKPYVRIEGNHAEIAKRFQEFTDVFKSKPYQRQKSALEQQLLNFLATLSPRKVFLRALRTMLLNS